MGISEREWDGSPSVGHPDADECGAQWRLGAYPPEVPENNYK